ncbi:DUF4153 domain-containing protein [Patescibacteria group bacterium]
MFNLKNVVSDRIVQIVLLSSLFSYFLVSLNWFPSLGLCLSFILLATYLFAQKKTKTRQGSIFFILTITFSLFIFARASAFLTFLNVIAVLYSGCLLINGKAPKNIIDSLLLPVNVFIAILTTSSKDKQRILILSKISSSKLIINRTNLIGSILISAIMLTITVPLLSFANPIFKQSVINIFSFLNYQNWLQRLIVNQPFFLWMLRLVFFIFGVIFLPRLSAVNNEKYDFRKRLKFGFNPLEAIGKSLFIPKILLIFVLTLFFVAQAQLYFAGPEKLLEIGYSHSKHAREVFSHLSLVTLMAFLLLYFDRSRSRNAKIVSLILLVQGLFLDIIAFKSDYDYVSTWGFTHKRLYGLAVVFWLFAIFLLFLQKFVYSLKEKSFIFRSVILTFVVLFIVNIANVDYLIYKFSKATTPNGIDHNYLSRLSTDAGSYNSHFAKLIGEIESVKQPDYKLISAARILENKISRLQKKYKKLNWQSYNLSEYIQHQKIKDLNMSQYHDLLYIARGEIVYHPAGEKISLGPTEIIKIHPYPSVQLDAPPPDMDPNSHTIAIQPKVNIKIAQIEPTLKNTNVEILDSNRELLSAQSLDTDSLVHAHGSGSFHLAVYQYVLKEEKYVQILVKEVPYMVEDGETYKEISL